MLALLLACGPECVDIDAECAPLYEPTFDNLHARTLAPTCALEGGCHASPDPAAGMDLSEIEGAYDALSERIDPEDPGCSLLLQRTHSDDDSFVMPPGAPLDAAELCVIRQWVRDGALR